MMFAMLFAITSTLVCCADMPVAAIASALMGFCAFYSGRLMGRERCSAAERCTAPRERARGTACAVAVP